MVSCSRSKGSERRDSVMFIEASQDAVLIMMQSATIFANPTSLPPILIVPHPASPASAISSNCDVRLFQPVDMTSFMDAPVQPRW